MIKRHLPHFPVLAHTHSLAGLLRCVWWGHDACVTKGRRIFSRSLQLFLTIQSPSLHTFSRKPPWLYTHTQTLPSLLLLYLPILPSVLQTRNGSILERKCGLWSICSVIQSFQIKGWFVFTTKSTDSARQRANILKCLSKSICVMAELSVSVCVCPCVYVCVYSCIDPFRFYPFVLLHSNNHYRLLFVADYYFALFFSHDVMSKLKGYGFPTAFAIVRIHLILSEVSLWKRTILICITMETTRFFPPQDLLKHFCSKDLFISQWKGWIWHFSTSCVCVSLNQ